MTNTEALKLLRKLPHQVPLKFMTDDFCKEYDEAINLMKNLIEKDAAKKPHKKGNCWWKCTSCGHDLKYVRDKKFCEFCGQKLDWSE